MRTSAYRGDGRTRPVMYSKTRARFDSLDGRTNSVARVHLQEDRRDVGSRKK